MNLAGKKRMDVSPFTISRDGFEGAGNTDIYKVWWAYERTYDSLAMARFIMILAILFGLLGFVLLQTERHQNSLQVQAAQQEAARANARVLKLVEMLPAK